MKTKKNLLIIISCVGALVCAIINFHSTGSMNSLALNETNVSISDIFAMAYADNENTDDAGATDRCKSSSECDDANGHKYKTNCEGGICTCCGRSTTQYRGKKRG